MKAVLMEEFGGPLTVTEVDDPTPPADGVVIEVRANGICRGRHVQIGLTLADHSDVPIPMNEVITRELEILGSHGMQAHRYPAMLDMIVSGRLEPARLIGKTVSLDEAPYELEAMTHFAQQGVIVIDRL